MEKVREPGSYTTATIAGKPIAVVRDKEGVSPLLLAFSEGCLECVDKLLQAKADISAQDKCGTTALAKASEQGYIYFVDVLLRKGADANVADKSGNKPLQVVLTLL